MYIPRCRLLVVVILLTSIAPWRSSEVRGQDEASVRFGLADRSEWTTSRLQGTPDPPLPYRVLCAFPHRKFRNPVFLAQEPGTSRLLVAELEGKIHAFDKTDREGERSELFLDLGRQIYAFSFHPRYVENGQVFVFCPESPDRSLSCVSRLQTNLSGPRVCDPQSEQLVIQWPSGGHNGGEAIFGPDGYLYISTGDGTSGSDLKATGQGVDDLLSVILRIDVDHPDNDRAYSIPPDNPFVSLEGARPEVWAFGFRNPWRMSFDAETQYLWVGDVGQDLWEMIWVARRGGNYGWSIQEGNHPFHPHKPSGPGPILPPVIEHPHTTCRSITGGYVYHGPVFPELQGAYVYGDYQYGKLWALRYDGQQVTWHQELADSALQIPGFAMGRDGEVFMVDHLGGQVHELVKAEPTAVAAPFPRKLSETGLLLDTARHTRAAGVVSYSVNSPQWLDGATAERFLGIAPESTVHFVERSTDENTWTFANGTATAQTISLALKEGDSTSARRLETRVMVKQEDHWLGYAYQWNAEQTDAELVGAEGAELVLEIEQADGSKRRQTWRIPSRAECMVCHSRAAGFVLGLNTLQMNRSHDYGDVRDNQLRAWNHAGYFDEPLRKAPHEYEALPDADADDDSVDLGRRARALLHVNCSVCHVSDGGGNAKFQLRFDLDDDELKLIDEPPIHGNFDLDGARLIAAGDPYSSVLFYRFSKTGRGRMPHVGAQTLDIAGADLLRQWILSLTPAAASADVATQRSALEQEWLQRIRSGESMSDAWMEQQLASTRRALLASDLLLSNPELLAASQSLIDRGAGHDSPNVRDLFERFLPESQRTRTLGDVFDPELVLQRQGDVERGRGMFFGEGGTQCKNCHRAGGQGSDFGPDLTTIGSKYTPRQLLDAVANPSLSIDPAYATQVVVTSQGNVYSGRLAMEDEQAIELQVIRGNEIERISIPRDQIEERTTQPTSLMPDRMLRDMTPQQAADLIAYLSLELRAESLGRSAGGARE